MIKELEELNIVDLSVLNIDKYFESYSTFLDFIKNEYWDKGDAIPSQILVSSEQYREICLWNESDIFICSSCQAPLISKLHTDFGTIRLFKKIKL